MTTQRHTVTHRTRNAAPSRALSPKHDASARETRTGLAAADAGYGRLARETGIVHSVLRIAGVDHDATAANAVEVIRGKVGGDVWKKALAAGGLAGSTVLLGALNAQKATTIPPIRRTPPPPVVPDAELEEEDDDECAECGHDRATHERGEGACIESGCDCDAFEEEEEEQHDMGQKKTKNTAAATMEQRIAAAMKNPAVIKIHEQSERPRALRDVAEAWVRAADTFGLGGT